MKFKLVTCSISLCSALHLASSQFFQTTSQPWLLIRMWESRFVLMGYPPAYSSTIFPRMQQTVSQGPSHSLLNQRINTIPLLFTSVWIIRLIKLKINNKLASLAMELDSISLKTTTDGALAALYIFMSKLPTLVDTMLRARLLLVIQSSQRANFQKNLSISDNKIVSNTLCRAMCPI